MEKVEALKMLEKFDPENVGIIKKEEERQKTVIGLIASENVASVLSTCLEGSAFTNKNTEGYPGKRYVGGCEYADAAEQIAIRRLKELFGCEHANINQGMQQ
jgi:glycine hydroxymethyltransferase